MTRKILFIGTLMWALLAEAQQTPLFSQYYLNPYLYNPATVGADGSSRAYFLYRRQWVGVDGAPETQAFTIDGQLNDQPIGLGLSFFNDINNVIGRVNGALTSSYRVKLNEHQELAFGMSFMAIQNKVFFDRMQVEDITDPGLLTKVDQRTVFDGNAGLSYTIRKLKIGFAADQLFQNEITHQNAAQFQSLDFNYVRHYVTSFQYDFAVNENVGIEPLLLVRTVQGLPSHYDLNVVVDYQERMWSAIAYRHQIGMAFSMGFLLQDQFVFGYTYELPTTDLSIIGSSSHEFVLGLRLNGMKGGGSSDGRRNDRRLEEIRSENAAQYQEIDELKVYLEESQEKINRQNAELEELRKAVGTYENELNEAIARLKVDLDHTEEYQEGQYYLVIGAFRLVETAKQFQRILKREIQLDTRIVQNENKTWYFVYSEEMQDLQNALDKIKSLEESEAARFIIGNPWIYEKKP